MKLYPNGDGVDKGEVTRYYIQCELENIVKGSVVLRDDAYHRNVPRLLEALSFTYRANGVFDCIENTGYRWQSSRVSIDDIALGGMGEALTKIIYSDEVKQNPRLFNEFLQERFNGSELGTLDYLEQLRPRPIPEDRKIMLLRTNHEGQLCMLDGSHRLMSLIANGDTEVDAYVGILTDSSAKGMVGDAIFIRLRNEWRHTTDEEYKSSIERTIIGLMRMSTDGENAVKKYWVNDGPAEDVRSAGERLLSEIVVPKVVD
jgi:hypothetical protein